MLAERHVQVKGIWYSVQRDASRGELLLGTEPGDTQLLTPDRHLGHLRFSRCDAPQDRQAQQGAEEKVRTLLAVRGSPKELLLIADVVIKKA